MSELKAYKFLGIDEVYSDANLGNEYYLKSAADKVIAEKDKEIDKLKESIGKLLKSKTEQIMDEVLEKVIIYGDGFVPIEHAMKLVAELRHYKYKWLLAKAELCDADACYQEMYIMDDKKATWFFNWEYKWRKLAEKFKEVK